MWYVKLNETVLPTPYQTYADCMAEVWRLKETMIAVCVEPVML